MRKGKPIDIYTGTIKVFFSGLPPKTSPHQEVFMRPAEWDEFAENRLEDSLYAREVEQYSSIRIQKDNTYMVEFLKEQGYEKIYLPPTYTGFFRNCDAYRGDNVDSGYRKLVHILHGEVMIHIIDQGDRTVFNQFITQLYERHGIKSLRLGIFGVNGEEMEDSVSIPWEPHRAWYGLRYAPRSYIPNPQKPAPLQ